MENNTNSVKIDPDICLQFEQILETCAKHAIKVQPTDFCKKLLGFHTEMCILQNTPERYEQMEKPHK